MNSNKNKMYISNTSPLYYTVDLVSVVSVLVLTTMLVPNQPACLNLVTPRPPYTKTRPLIPQLCAPSQKQQSAGVLSLFALTDIFISASWRLLLLLQPLGVIWKRKYQNSKIIKENILVSISIDFTTILKSKLPFYIWHPKCIIHSSHSLLDSILTLHSHSLPWYYNNDMTRDVCNGYPSSGKCIGA